MPSVGPVASVSLNEGINWWMDRGSGLSCKFYDLANDVRQFDICYESLLVNDTLTHRKLTTRANSNVRSRKFVILVPQNKDTDSIFAIVELRKKLNGAEQRIRIKTTKVALNPACGSFLVRHRGLSGTRGTRGGTSFCQYQQRSLTRHWSGRVKRQASTHPATEQCGRSGQAVYRRSAIRSSVTNTSFLSVGELVQLDYGCSRHPSPPLLVLPLDRLA